MGNLGKASETPGVRVLAALMDLPFPARVATSVALLAPLGIALGMPMPLGLARFSALYPRSVAYAWG